VPDPAVTRDPGLDPQLLQLLQMMDAMQAKPMYEGTVEEARAANAAMPVDPAAVPQLAAVEDVSVAGAAGDIRARVYRPSLDGARPTIVFFHGGGFAVGSLDMFDIICRTLALAADAVVVAVDYRLAPENPAPAAAQDAVAATRWVADRLGELGGSDVLGVAGDSAGGNLAAGVAQALRDEGRPLAGQLLFYPLTDFAGGAADYPSMSENASGYMIDAPSIAWFQEQYVGHLDGAALADPVLSPLRGDVAGVAPAIVVTAEFDPLRDQGIAYAEKLRAAGVPVQAETCPGLIHSFLNFALMVDAARAAQDEAFRAFRDLLHG